MPVAYYNTKSSTLYSSDLKNVKEIPFIDPVKVQFDPFIFEDILKSDPDFTKDKRSNQEWKIHVDFQDSAAEEMKEFE